MINYGDKMYQISFNVCLGKQFLEKFSILYHSLRYYYLLPFSNLGYYNIFLGYYIFKIKLNMFINNYTCCTE